MAERQDGHEDQIRHGTFREQLVQLQRQIHDAVAAGAATPQEYEATLTQLLKAIEGLRLKQQSEIQRIREKIVFHEATMKSCSLISSMLISIVTARRNEWIRAQGASSRRAVAELEEDRLVLQEYEDSEQWSKHDELKAEIARKEVELAEKYPEADVIPLGSREEKNMVAGVVADSIRETRTPSRVDRGPAIDATDVEAEKTPQSKRKRAPKKKTTAKRKGY